MESIDRIDAGGRTQAILSKCTDCGVCWKSCRFLKEFGTPYEIAVKVAKLPPEEWPDPFACSLCGLCGALCPEGLRPVEMFREMRRAMVRAGKVDLKLYAPILTYEALGASSLFSMLRLPEGGDTVLFPGCTVPGTRPDTTRQLFLALRDHLPDLGIALGCCAKPSHDLGREAVFKERFGRLHGKLSRAGVKRVVTTCPNCHNIFSQYGKDIDVVTAYELLAEVGVEADTRVEMDAVVHDPCVIRHEGGVQDAVRILSKRCGVSFKAGRKERRLTTCCGEGGMVSFVRPELADMWTKEQEALVGKRAVVTSCAGCVGSLGKSMDAHHVLDLLFDSRPENAIKPPFTYWERLKLKWWFRKNG
ncbi:(Fe-S)-binding protein [Pseudodesulfovibrio sp. zrk46]|uniref:(Fe-S)-binding protein n=1 Tax=Pseudodesulfovibrio sp. zrk46 TaxID=2725288 RepID=UPI001449A189|nr:(Fe-S)-binding protein [Pseudodesulfovibrio sp. zrk46]QJB55002.1 (Fe-S)-binding protein [Pseudodesulfovibrio sp. zrk46]